MADGTHIEWTDATWNIVNGCSVLSPGCTNCYAMRLAGTRLKHVESRVGLTIDTKAGPVWNGTTKFNEPVLLDPIRWKRPRKIFVCAHGDLFHDSVPDEWIDRVFAVMALAPQHQFQVLTKRSVRMREYMTRLHDEPEADTLRRLVAAWPKGVLTPEGGITIPLPNVWLGVSVEDQKRADERIPDLLQTPAAVRWLSCEPLLGEVDLNLIHEQSDDGLSHSWESCLNGKRFDFWGDGPDIEGCPKIDWVVAGGESGPGARPMHPDWAKSLRDQCAAANVPFLFKQWGEWREVDNLDGSFGTIEIDNDSDDADALYDTAVRPALMARDGRLFDRSNLPEELPCRLIDRVGKKAAGRLLDGVTHDGFPA